MRKKKRQRYLVRVVPGEGDPCPRCGVPMQIREYNNSTEQHLHRPYFYTRWFCCMDKSCRTTLVMRRSAGRVAVGNYNWLSSIHVPLIFDAALQFG